MQTICFLERAGCEGGGKGILCSIEKTFTLSTVDMMRVCMEDKPIKTIVRRLTPIEAERLQGFPDGYTDIPWAGKETSPDSRRYKALGNSMAVPVMQWIGQRIQNQNLVVYNEDAIRNALFVAPICEKEDGQLNLFS